ncbi:MAG: hypothetical protein IPN32_25555 [Deltaproteobacteria bacterium]|nr:hypothetical protein [Deltaproteobacteria bacterium]
MPAESVALESLPADIEPCEADMPPLESAEAAVSVPIESVAPPLLAELSAPPPSASVASPAQPAVSTPRLQATNKERRSARRCMDGPRDGSRRFEASGSTRASTLRVRKFPWPS